MIVSFEPTSEQMSTEMATFQKGPIITGFTPPYITVPSGTTAVQGTTTGSAAYALGQGATNLSWYLPGNANATASWAMDDEDAVDAAIAALLAAIEADSTAVVLSSNGTVSAAS